MYSWEFEDRFRHGLSIYTALALTLVSFFSIVLRGMVNDPTSNPTHAALRPNG